MSTARRTRRRHRVAGILGLAALLCVGCDGAKGTPPAPTLELGPCPGSSVADARCGVLTVLEDRGAPDGRTIDLAIFVAPATARAPAPDPVFLLAGGPGQGAASLAPHLTAKLEALRRDRDLVFVDVRGTGQSNALACDIEDPEDLDQLLGAIFEPERLDGCVASYAGADLSQYTSAVMADDLDEVRAALGYEQINLFAISYGTLLAQLYMRRHGEHVRSAVLDGVVPTDRQVIPEMPVNAERALKRVLADCREDRDCAATFPGLERKLAAVLEELDGNRELERFAHPRTGEIVRVELTRAGFASALVSMLYRGSSQAKIPLLIERAYAGDYAPLAAEALSKATHAKTFSLGMHLSVVCAEELADFDEARLIELRASLEFLDGHVISQLGAACARWPHAPLDPGHREPFRSTTPILLLSGAYDPVTPPSLGEHLASQLGDARHVVVEGVSHGVWAHGCATQLMADFFAKPDPAGVDPSCLDTLSKDPPFLGANGPWLPSPATDEPERQAGGQP